MDAERLRIEEDLRGQIVGEVHCNDLYAQLYASDASIYELPPLGVVRPRTVDDVVATVQYASEHGISLHPRGGGSGLAGESLGRGLIVDFSRYFRKITDTSDHTVRTQAGVVLNRLNAHLEKRGRRFGPDPAMSSVTTIGSVVAVNATGSHWPRYGSASEHIVSLEVVLADGNIARLERHSIPSNPPLDRGHPTESTSQGIERPPLSRLVDGLDGILTRHRKAIDDYKTHLQLNRSGYGLRDLRTGNQLDLARLLAGSEGSLALVTEATLATVPLPNHAGSLLFFFHSLENAIHGARKLTSEQPTACVLMDRRHLNLARESAPRFELLIPQAAEAVLLVEHHADTSDQLREKLNHTCRQLQEGPNPASDCSIATDPLDHQMLWQLAEYYGPSFYQLKGSTRPIPFIEEIVVPPEMLPDMLHRLQTALNKEQVTASIFGQPLQGQLHIRPLLDLANARDVRKMTALAEQVYEHAWACDGSITGEHGDGLSRIPYADRQFGPLADAYREVKKLFDPQGILNPGKIVPRETCQLTDNLRRISYPLHGPSEGLVELQLDWQPEEMALTARNCNGCAECRTQDAGVRMCPIFRIAPREEASPRAKANLARGILTGQLPPETIHEDEFKLIADLCVHCHMCRLECPSHVDIPKLMIEAKATYLATNGQGFHDWVLMHIDSLCKTASRLSRISNWVISNRVARWLTEKTLGIAQGASCLT